MTTPFVILKTLFQYYTTGTIYSNTNREFNTLYKNIHLSVESHLANNFQLADIPIVVYQSMTKTFANHKSNPMVSSGNLKHYGEKFNDHSYWIHKNDESENVLIYFHGGGYALNCFDTQFSGFLALYHALPEHTKLNISFLIVDYSLTFQSDGKFPRQIFEALEVYNKLINSGFSKVHIIGDSAGGNLAIALLRFLNYPEETSYFAKFPQYDFKQFNNIKVQPESCILISPWVQPLHITSNRKNINNVGDLGARSTIMGDWYVDGVERDDELTKWVSFSKLRSEDFERIEVFKNKKAILIYGEREVLTDGIEDFRDLIKKFGELETFIEPGGIHVGLFYVESMDYMGSNGIRAIKGDFKDKFSLNTVSDFLGQAV